MSSPEKVHWRFPLVWFATWDRSGGRVGAHAERLEPSLLACGHGKVVKDPAAAIDKALHQCPRGLHPDAVVEAAARSRRRRARRRHARAPGRRPRRAHAVAVLARRRPRRPASRLAARGARAGRRAQEAAAGAPATPCARRRRVSRLRPRAPRQLPRAAARRGRGDAGRALRVFTAVLAGYGLAATTRSTRPRFARRLHGFAALEAGGGFGWAVGRRELRGGLSGCRPRAAWLIRFRNSQTFDSYGPDASFGG